jgi:hypothetical protein
VDVWQVAPDGDKLAELDCLSLSFDPQLRHTSEVIEAKTTGGSKGEIDRVLWLRGAGALIKADRVTFAKLQFDARVPEVARGLDVSLLDEASVAAAETAARVQPNAWVGVHDPDLGQNVIKRAREELTGSIPLRRIGRFLFGRFWFDEEFTRLKRLRTACHLLADHQNDVSREALTLAGGEVATLFAISAYGVAAWRSQYAEVDFARFVLSELSTGLGDPGGLRQLLRRVDQMNRVVIEDLHDAYAATGVARLSRAIPALEAEILRPPEWADGFVDLTARLLADARVATAVLRSLDLRLGYRLGSRRSTAEVERGWATDAKVVKTLTDTIESFLVRVWGLPQTVFDALPRQIASDGKAQRVTVRRAAAQSHEPVESPALPGIEADPRPASRVVDHDGGLQNEPEHGGYPD